MPAPGKSNNYKGRPKGSPNKANRPLKDNISDFLQKSWNNIEKDLSKLDPAQRVQAYIKLCDFVLPKMKSLDANISIEQKLEGMSNEKLNKLINQILNEPIDAK